MSEIHNTNKNLLIFSIANADFVKKFKRKDLLSQDLNGYFNKVHYVFLVDKPFKPYTEKIDDTYTILYLSNKRFTWLKKGKLKHLNTAVSLVYNLFYLWRYTVKNSISVLFAQEPFIRGSLAYAISKVTGKPYVVEVCSNFKNKHWEEGRLELPVLKTVGREKRLLHFTLLHANGVMADRDNYWNEDIIPHELGKRYFRYHFSMEEAHYNPPGNRLNLK